MKIETTNQLLNISPELVQIIERELAKAGLSKASAVLNFKDPDYSAVSGGYHPVEIAVRADGRLSYITDFAYFWMGDMAELGKELDFDFSLGLFQQMGQDHPIEQGAELFKIWQQNFCSYYRNGVYQITVTHD